MELINESGISNTSPDNFKESLKINPKFKTQIPDVYSKALLNLGRIYLSIFHLKYLEMFEDLALHYGDNDELYELSDSLTGIIDSYFSELNDNLYIRDMDDLNELKFTLKISSICIEAVLEDKDIELAYEVFFNIDRRIERKKLYKKADNNEGDY